MSKQLVKNYSFSTTAKTVTLTDFTTVLLERLQLIVNTTTNTILYNFADFTVTAATVSGNVITLTTLTGTNNNADKLMVVYDTQQGDPHYDDYQLIADVASNNVVATGTISAVDAASTSTAGQGSQLLITGTPTAGSIVNLAIPLVNGTTESMSNIVLFVSGTFTGTYALERSPDGGTTWTAFACFIAGTADTVQSGTAPGMFHGNAAGVTNIRVRATALTSGSISVRMQTGIGTGTITVGNPLRLYDGVSKVQASIKAASTAPVATDSALVTAESPNSALVSNTARIPAQGAAATAASTPVNIASDQVVPVSSGSLTSSFSVTTVSNTTSIDASLYRWVSVQIVTQGTGSTVTFQTSNDNTNWKNETLYFVDTNGTNGLTSTGSAGVMAHGPMSGRYFRLAITGISAGTTAGSIFLSAMPSALHTLGVQQSGTWTVQPGNTVNTSPWLVRENNPATPAVTSVTSATTAATLLASNTARRQALFYNASTAILYLRIGGTATTATGGYTIQIAANAYYELPYPACTAAISGIWSAANGAVSITEIT